MDNNISFGATFRLNTYINASKTHKRTPAAIVELAKTDVKDIDTLVNISRDWEKDGKKNSGFSNYVNMILARLSNDDADPEQTEHYLALTLQKDNYEKLNSKDVLGVSLFTENGTAGDLDFLQVAPKTCKTFETPERKYRNVGSAMIDYLKKAFSNVHIFVNPAPSAKGFYTKKGFVQYCKECSWYWHLPKNN